jgi:hypothetical protein
MFDEQIAETGDAFRYIIGFAATLKGFDCHPGLHGKIRDFRFFDRESDEQPFAFIPNKKWLLFYLRPQAVRSGKYSLEDLRTVFKDVGTIQPEHWTVKLQTVDDVKKLAAFLHLS